MRNLSTSFQNAINSPNFYAWYAVELFFDTGTIRLWTGNYDTTFNSEGWIGSGNLLGIGPIEQDSELSVRGAEITLSGMTTEILALSLQSQYQGRLCRIYLGFSVDENLINSTLVFSGYMDQMNILEGPSSGVISLKVENKLIDLERPRVSRFTNEYQKSKYPDDRGLQYVASIQDRPVLWGRTIPNGN